jgi:hypothetical protein
MDSGDMEHFEDAMDYQIPDTFTIKLPEYTRYKSLILGLQKPNMIHKHCTFYNISGKQVEKFVNNIKHYGLNLNVNTNHINEMRDALLAENEPHLCGYIAVIEYSDYKADNYENLIELIDGHHRIECLQAIFAIKPNFNISLLIGLHSSDMPNSIQTKNIFRKYNSAKPFIVDINVSTFSGEIIDALNNRFSSSKFILIRDDKKIVQRPSISKITINKIIQERLEQIKRTGLLVATDLNIQTIIDRFVMHNNIFTKQSFNWFNTAENEFRHTSVTGMSLNIFEKAKNVNCCIGIVDLQILIKICIA